MGSHRSIIIGGGTAGCVLANLLSEDPSHEVTLVEKGRDYPAGLPDELLYAFFATEPSKHRAPSDKRLMLERIVATEHFKNYETSTTALVPRGEVIGGSGSVNAAIYLWGLPEDYDEDWSQRGLRGWSYQDVQPHFAAVESDRDYPGGLHGSDGPVKVTRSAKDEYVGAAQAFYSACRGLGHPEAGDFNVAPSLGVGSLPFNVEAGVRFSAAVSHLGPEVRKRPNLRIVDLAEVSQLLIEGSRCLGIRYSRQGKVEELLADEVIVSSGPIQSPKLLMLSGIGDPDELARHGISTRHDIPGVGQNLLDHPCVDVLIEDESGRHWGAPTGFQVACRYTASNSPYRADMHLNFVPFGVEVQGTKAGIRSDQFGIGTHLYRPLGCGRLTLNPNDAHGDPVLDYRYLSNDEDRRRMREGVRKAVEILRSKDFAEAKIQPKLINLNDTVLGDDDKLDAWMLENCKTGQHTSGTCLMGPLDDPMSVVDRYARVRGIDGLRVIDSSIMPTCIRANTNAPTFMLAHKLGTEIARGDDR